jgi:hypothetical protein
MDTVVTKNAKVAAVILVVATAILLLGWYRVRWVTHKEGNAALLWNDHEAYLFIPSGRLGYERSPVRFVGERIAARFGIMPTETRNDLMIVRFGDSVVERNTMTNVTTTEWRVVDGQLYTLANGSLVRLAGTRFEAASPADLRRFDAADAPTNETGWFSELGSILHRGPVETQFALQIRGKAWIVVAHNNPAERWAAIDVEERGQSPQRVWRLDTRPRYVTKKEYEAFLNR